jgi:hypothetical protein
MLWVAEDGAPGNIQLFGCQECRQISPATEANAPIQGCQFG